MTDRIQYTLIGDGTSDRVLTHVADWILRTSFPHALLEDAAFLARAHQPIPETVALARRRYGRELILVHRDAERETWEMRAREIPAASGLVRLIPVRMTEAWLLGDEAAIRYASGRPNGDTPLSLPKVADSTSLPDPKAVLREALVTAAGHPRGRRLKSLRRELPHRTMLVAEYTDSWDHLQELEAFRRFRADLLAGVEHQVSA